jgi:hypothetical protein
VDENDLFLESPNLVVGNPNLLVGNPNLLDGNPSLLVRNRDLLVGNRNLLVGNHLFGNNFGLKSYLLVGSGFDVHDSTIKWLVNGVYLAILPEIHFNRSGIRSYLE